MRRAILSAVLICLALPAALAADRDCLYQVSTLDALLAGVFDAATTVGELRQHGDTGIGCFAAVDGEMIALDGKFYQVRADGSVHRRLDHAGVPFASVSFLDRDREIALTQPLDLAGLTAFLDAHLPGRNLFCALRLEGEFEYVKTRSVPRQHKPYPKLLDVAAKQPTFEFTNVRGVLIGLFCPYFTAGANMPGYHFHFLNETRTGGGHLLACRLTRGTAWLDPTPRYTLILPQSPEFMSLGAAQPDTAGAHAVESDRE